MIKSFESFFDEEWESLSKIFSGDHDINHFLGHGLYLTEQDHGLNFENPSSVSSSMTESNNANTLLTDDHIFGHNNENMKLNFYHNFPQETCNNGYVAYDNIAASLPYQSCNIILLPTNGACDHKNSSLLSQVISDDSMEENQCLTENINIENSVNPSVEISNQLKYMPDKKRIKTPEDQFNEEKPDEKPKKKTRVSKDNKNKKQRTKNGTLKGIDGQETYNNKIEGNASIASSSSGSSEDDSNNRGAENSNRKTRAGRGAATDPQSLYVRKRRERINERLKVLQNLVPNGTKVDISTMLEEAVQYLLSSDEMWMYAPIAYNGMDMGLYQKLSRS